MLELMKPGESVAKSLRRLGGGAKKLTSAQRLKAKKQGIKPTEEEMKNKESMQTLTSLADKLIQSGKMFMVEIAGKMSMVEIAGKMSMGGQ